MHSFAGSIGPRSICRRIDLFYAHQAEEALSNFGHERLLAIGEEAPGRSVDANQVPVQRVCDCGMFLVWHGHGDRESSKVIHRREHVFVPVFVCGKGADYIKANGVKRRLCC